MSTTIKLEDTNLGLYDSAEAQEARKTQAKLEQEYKQAGKKVGLEIWRVENERTTGGDLPNFGIKVWNLPGQFHSGDSYIVLNTYKSNDKLLYDLHYWIGKESTQDEYGVAAYKSVELDDLLDGTPVEHREVEGYESSLFKSYFPNGIIYLQGGHASGFRPGQSNEVYKPRLFQLQSDSKKRVQAYEVKVDVSSLSQADVFILDLGKTIYVFNGDCSDHFERLKASVMAKNLSLGRSGPPKVMDQVDDLFWKTLNGTLQDVTLTTTTPSSSSNASKLDDSMNTVDINNVSLYRLTDESGEMKFLKVHSGRVYPSMLRAKDVFILDSGPEIFVWIGVESSPEEKSQSMSRALQYLKNEGKNTKLPITKVIQNEPNKAFDEIVFAGKNRKGWLARSLGATEQDPTLETFETVLGAFGELFDTCTGGRDIAKELEKEWNIVDRGTIERDSIQTRSQEPSQPPKGAVPLDIRL
jgi:gelsolin